MFKVVGAVWVPGYHHPGLTVSVACAGGGWCAVAVLTTRSNNITIITSPQPPHILLYTKGI